MKKTIWKFPLNVTGSQLISIPGDSEILTVSVQGEAVCLWALVDPSTPKKDVLIEIFGTGHPVNYDMGTSREYISTFQLKGGQLVFHAFLYTGV